MLLEHLEAYEIALVVWSFVFGLLGLQGLISIYLEGDIKAVGTHAPPQPTWPILILVVALLAVNFWSAWTFVQLLFNEGAPETLGRLAALMAFILAALVAIYRRYCIEDIVVGKTRDDGIPW